MFPLKDNIPTRRFPFLTVLFIAINVVVWLFVQKAGTAGNEQYFHYGAVPCDLTGSGPASQCPDQPTTWITPVTSMFMHGGWLHIIGNMLFLWIFGNNVEDSMGPVRFVVFYFVGGFCALALQSVIDPSSAAPTVGASGAIAGVLGGYLVLYPKARVLTGVFVILFFTLIEIPAMLFLLIWIGEQVLFAALDLSQPAGTTSGGVAYFAHIGGFAFGALFIRAFATRRNDRADAPRIPVY
jgi:membrane associated rhomboid family serine protease